MELGTFIGQICRYSRQEYFECYGQIEERLHNLEKILGTLEESQRSMILEQMEHQAGEAPVWMRIHLLSFCMKVSKTPAYTQELLQTVLDADWNEVRSKYEDSLKNAKEQIAGDAWETLSVDQIAWKSDLSQELTNVGLEDVIYDYGDGAYLQVTKNGYVYYGGMKDGKRNGDNGIWLFLYSNGGKYCFKGMWEDGYPNGLGEKWYISQSGDMMMITTGMWRDGLEEGKMQMKYLGQNESRIFEYSVSLGMPEIIDYDDVENGDRHCVLAYIEGETDIPDSYGYENELAFPLGIHGL